MPSPAEHHENQALLRELHSSGDPASVKRAVELQKVYHDREMARICDDVYDAAMGEGSPEPGWLRASENMHKLREQLPHLRITDEQLKGYLHPRESGFRAEIYLPNPEVLGPGFKPTLVFKGSSGQIMTSEGLRDTTIEDFAANNFPQAIGQKTDYYDRAMELATQLKSSGIDFEVAGHSLAGGKASAVSAVTGVQATTFNAAGLHPETARRFAQENPGVQVYDVSQRVTAYQVSGEFLNDGVQDNIDRLDAYRRIQLGGVLKEASELLKALPEGRDALKQGLEKSLPPHAHASVHAFVDRLADGNTAQMLRDLPLAAGEVQPVLMAMTERNGRIVERERQLSLQELTDLAKPLMTTLHVTALGAHAGHRTGEAVATGGRITERALDLSGDATRGVTETGADLSRNTTLAAGVALRTSVRSTGAAFAGVREAASEMEAGIDRFQGQAQLRGASFGADMLRRVGDLVPDGIERRLDGQADRLQEAGEQALRRNLAEAAEATRDGREDVSAIRGTARVVDLEVVTVTARTADFQRDSIAAPGRWVDGALDTVGQYGAQATREAPSYGAKVGAATAVSAAVTQQFNPLDPADFPNLAKAATFADNYQGSLAEAKARHSTVETIIPSIEHRIDALELEARRHLQRLADPTQDQGVPSQPPASVIPGIGINGGRDRTRHEQDQEEPQLLPQRDARAQAYPANHQDYALFEAIRRQLPDGITDERAAHVVLQAKIGGVERADQLNKVVVQGETAFVVGNTPGFRATVDLAAAPPLPETLRLSESFDRQQTQQLAQDREQQAQINARNQNAQARVV